MCKLLEQNAHIETCESLVLKKQQSKAPRLYPKANVIHSRKPHIWSTNHYWNKPVSKSSHQCRHYNKEQHQQSMSSNQYVIDLSISCLNSRSCTPQFHTNKQTHCSRNNTRPPCKNKVEHSNVFCIGTAKPTDKKVIPFTRSIFHFRK